MEDRTMMYFEKDLVNKAIELIDEKSKADELKAFTDVSDINKMIENLQTSADYRYYGIQLDERLRRDYPSIEKLQELGRNMVNNSGNNNTKYDVVSAIIANLNADKYGIYADVLLKHEVINDMKKFIEKVD
jgi:hypothetical protein